MKFLGSPTVLEGFQANSLAFFANFIGCGEDHPFQGAKTAPGSSANNFNVHHLNYSNSSREFEYLHADFNTLNTKSSFLGEEDDYFLSLSKDRRFLTPIPVSEL